MKQSIIFMCSLIAALTASGCFINFDDDDGIGCLRGNGPVVTEIISMPDFHGIELTTSADVFIKQGPVQRVEVEGKENLIPELSRRVSGGIWKIQFDRSCVRNVGDMRIFITLPDLSSLRSSGSGDIVSENIFLAPELTLFISGSGNIDLGAETAAIDATITGSGKMFLEGFAAAAKYRISGSGDVRAFNLESRTADVNISGSGDCELFVTEFLKVRISGSGDVFYQGNPSVDVSISGSGKVVKVN
jgi:hypothetical protein